MPPFSDARMPSASARRATVLVTDIAERYATAGEGRMTSPPIRWRRYCDKQLRRGKSGTVEAEGASLVPDRAGAAAARRRDRRGAYLAGHGADGDGCSISI